MTALLLVAIFWLATYLLTGWYGVTLIAIVGVMVELLLFGSATLHERRLR